jgi:hypothetical protein
MGTRFTATRESLWDLAMKAAAVAAGGDQTEQTRVFDVVRAALWPAIFIPACFAERVLGAVERTGRENSRRRRICRQLRMISPHGSSGPARV